MIKRRFLAVLCVFLGLATQAFADSPAIRATHGMAIDGFDPVAYFTDGRPIRGEDAHRLMWRGAVWYFSSAANRELFESNPRVYAPKYGGYCAYAVALGVTSHADPNAWTIHDGRLYLVRNAQVQVVWQRDIAGNIQRADANWPDVLSR